MGLFRRLPTPTICQRGHKQNPADQPLPFCVRQPAQGLLTNTAGPGTQSPGSQEPSPALRSQRCPLHLGNDMGSENHRVLRGFTRRRVLMEDRRLARGREKGEDTGVQ